MSQFTSPATPTLGILRRLSRSPENVELQWAPRRRSGVLVATPKLARKEISSPARDNWETRNLSNLHLTPTSRGSPLLPTKSSQSPKLRPSNMKTVCGSPYQQSPKKYLGDRFIPTRSRASVDQNNLLMLGSPYRQTTPIENKQIPAIRVLAFGSGSPKNTSPQEIPSSIGQFKVLNLKEIKSPDRILDAPGVLLDKGNHLLDWSLKNVLALALDDTVYLWNSITHKTEVLCTSPIYTWIMAVRWNQEGNLLAVAVSDGKIHCWNYDTGALLRSCKPYCITSLTWIGQQVTCGDFRGHIHKMSSETSDLEEGIPVVAHPLAVTSLSWNKSGEMLASGCEDGTVKIWASTGSKPLHVLQTEINQITTIQWSPFMNSVLAVGTESGNLLFWRIGEKVSLISEMNTCSKISDLKWFPPSKGVFTSHFNGDINFFTYPYMKNIKRFTGSEGPVISLALAPDYRCLMSLCADETLRLWSTAQEDTKQSVSPMNKPGLR